MKRQVIVEADVRRAARDKLPLSVTDRAICTPSAPDAVWDLKGEILQGGAVGPGRVVEGDVVELDGAEGRFGQRQRILGRDDGRARG